MKRKVRISLFAVLSLAAGALSSLHAQAPAAPAAPAASAAPASPAPGVVSVNLPLIVPPTVSLRPAAEIARLEVKLARGVGGAVFTQRVPPEASKVLQAVSVQIEKLHPGRLKTGRIEITYLGNISPQDVPASGLALAVALDALLGNWTPDPGFMAIGTFEADGDVQPVASAIPRLLAVMKAGAKRVVMTEKQVAQVTDLMVSSGAKLFSGTQFFAVNSYEDVRVIADSAPPFAMAKALKEFGEVQEKLNAPGAKPEDVLRDEDVKEALRQTMVNMPTNLSARLLLRVTAGQFEKLSAEGTLYTIENLAPTIFTTVQSRTPGDVSKLSNDVVQAEIALLNEKKQHFNVNSLPLLNAVINYGELMRSYTERPPDSALENGARIRSLNSTAQGVIAELTKFRAAQAPKRR